MTSFTKFMKHAFIWLPVAAGNSEYSKALIFWLGVQLIIYNVKVTQYQNSKMLLGQAAVQHGRRNHVGLGPPKQGKGGHALPSLHPPLNVRRLSTPLYKHGNEDNQLLMRVSFTVHMSSMKLVILLLLLYQSIHTKDESKLRAAFAFIFGVN